MLLSDAKSIYINNKEAKEIWYGGSRIWTPVPKVPSKCLTDTYTWSQISQISANGTANEYFNLGDTAKVTSASGIEYTLILAVIYIDKDVNNNPVLTFVHRYADPCSWYTGSSGFKAYTDSNCIVGSAAKNLANALDTAMGGNILKTKNVGYYASAGTTTVSTTQLKGWVLCIGEINNTGSGIAKGIYYPYLYDNAVEIFGTVTESYDYWSRETGSTYVVYWMGMDNNNKMVRVSTTARNESKNIVMAFCV